MWFSRNTKRERNYLWESVGGGIQGPLLPQIRKHDSGNEVPELKSSYPYTSYPVSQLCTLGLPSSDEHQNLFLSPLFLVMFLPLLSSYFMEGKYSHTLSLIFLFLKSIPFGLALAELCNLHGRGNPFPLFSGRAAPLKSQLA